MLRCGRKSVHQRFAGLRVFDARAMAYPGSLACDMQARLNAMLVEASSTWVPMIVIYLGAAPR